MECLHWLCWRKGFLVECVYWFVCCLNQWKAKILSLVAVVIPTSLAFTRQLTSWSDVIGTLLVQRFIFQSSWFNFIRRVTVSAAEFAFPSTCSSSSTWQAITYASTFFPLQCIFLLLSYRTFNSDTNTFSTSYAQILSIPFTNCAGGRQVLPLRRQNLGEENTRSCKGMGKVGTKALFAHATWMKWTTTKIDVSVGWHLNWIHTITIVSILARWIECLWWI